MKMTLDSYPGKAFQMESDWRSAFDPHLQPSSSMVELGQLEQRTKKVSLPFARKLSKIFSTESLPQIHKRKQRGSFCMNHSNSEARLSDANINVRLKNSDTAPDFRLYRNNTDVFGNAYQRRSETVRIQRSISRKKILDSLFEEPIQHCWSSESSEDSCDEDFLSMRPIPEVHARVRRNGVVQVVSRSNLVHSLLERTWSSDTNTSSSVMKDSGIDLTDNDEIDHIGLCQDVIDENEQDMFKTDCDGNNNSVQNNNAETKEKIAVIVFDFGIKFLKFI